MWHLPDLGSDILGETGSGIAKCQQFSQAYGHLLLTIPDQPETRDS